MSCAQVRRAVETGAGQLPDLRCAGEEMFPGREVKLTGRIEDYDWSANGPFLRLEAQRVE